ncbi:Signal recognition particle [Macleaya cordata]|uniref:Signal recognition particle n=1 Tax=Macleaya cordata TaxID=56857 RepID=A0A200PT15_MACCD|nr:Signal recognition particle [Macleaya cordata]
MLEQLLIFTRGGLILWTCKELGNALKGSPIDTLIRSCLLEERSGDSSYNYDAPGATYTLKWTFHNELGLIFVAVYNKILHLLYVDDLLSMVKQEFSEIYDPKRTVYNEFDDVFRQLRKEAEARAEELKKSKQVAKPSNVSSKKQGQAKVTRSDGNGKQRSNGSSKDGGDSDSSKSHKLENGNANGHQNGIEETVVKSKENGSSGAFDVNKLHKLRSKGAKKQDNVAIKAPPKVEPKKKATKKNRVWDDSPPESKLDFADPVDERGIENMEVVAENHGESMMDKEEVFSSDSESESEKDEKAVKDSKLNEKKKGGWFSSMFQSIAGKANLEKSDLEPALKALKDRLLTKNVAEEIAEKLCESVAASLEGKKLASFTRVSSTVQAAMEAALVRILTPRRSIDVLRDVHAAKEQGRPYVIVFVGVNGVGKSTNLAKVVAYWLLQHKVSVMMAACDTFRSGAVEQLRTHARRLQIPIFEKGYERDPAVVAKEAIQEATRNGSDVVLVDTAGRMQDNEPLMRALSKLIYLNNPDLVLFVGEALVGNDAVDQLSKFNQKLADLSNSPSSRVIDGIVLTKFDCIDDKVGAALSMVYISGAPVMFVGCGQSYTDLKKLNVKSIVKTLLK